MYCNNICGVIDADGEHNLTEWRLFNDSSQNSLKAALSHSGNKFHSVSLAHGSKIKGTWDNLKFLLEKYGTIVIKIKNL